MQSGRKTYSSAASVDPGHILNASMWHSAVSRISRTAVSAICLVPSACTLLLYQYQAPQPTSTKPSKPLITSSTSLVVGIFIVRQPQHRSSRRSEPDGGHNRSTTTFEIPRGALEGVRLHFGCA